MTIELEITRTIEVEVNVSPGRKGSHDSLCGVCNAGPPLEPDELPEVEIVSAKWQVGDKWANSQCDKIFGLSESSLRKHLRQIICNTLEVELSGDEEEKVREIALEQAADQTIREPEEEL